ncbi:MAG TPA: HlyD family efflux transporter periplasmic adaptor subunit [Steroidobacteraceae bacterium]|nr:HlyD family efflux transporter periplasmic adaptor subunit [Steroidobacteraceae bacterium]
MRAMTRRLLFWGGVAGAIAIGLLVAFRPRPVTVDIVDIQRGSLVVTVGDEGITRVHDIYVLSAPVTGRVHRIDLHVGDPVIAGKTVVAQIEPIDPAFLDPRSEAQAKADVSAAESAEKLARADVEMAQAELDFALRQYERARQLILQGTISQRDLEDAERTYRTRQASLLTFQAALDRSRFQLQGVRAELLSPAEVRRSGSRCACIALRAPVDGQILRLLQQSEAVVAASTPLVEIGDPQKLEIVVDLLSADAVKVKPGQRAIIEGWGGSAPLEGRVRLVEPFGFTKISALGIEEQRVNVIIDLVSPREQWTRLAHGYQIEARIVLSEREQILKLPLTAVFRDGTQWAAFLEVGDRAELRHVTLGERNGTEAEIIAGVREGEHVVLHPSDRVGDGVRIVARAGPT